MNHRLIAGAAGFFLVFGIAPAAFADVAGTDEEVEEIDHDDDGVVDETRETNNVDCGEAGPQDVAIDPLSTQVKTEGGADGGAAVVCKDGAGPLAGTPADVEGRVIAAGGPSDGGGYVAVDGDRDNNAEAQGWIRADVGSDPGVACSSGSAEEGIPNPDSTDPGEDDGLGDCPVFEDAGIDP